MPLQLFFPSPAALNPSLGPENPKQSTSQARRNPGFKLRGTGTPPPQQTLQHLKAANDASSVQNQVRLGWRSFSHHDRRNDQDHHRRRPAVCHSSWYEGNLFCSVTQGSLTSFGKAVQLYAYFPHDLASACRPALTTRIVCPEELRKSLEAC